MGNYSEAHICQCLSRLATARRHSAVTIYGDRRKNGMQFVDDVLRLVHSITSLGINPGDVVSISALNSDLYLEWILAITYVGGIVAPLNYRWSMEEAKSAMEVVQPVMLVTDSSHEFWHSKFQIDSVPSLRWHVLMDTPVESRNTKAGFVTELLRKPTRGSVALDYLWAPEKAALICFTSGTTGRPKGATISHSALVVQSLAKLAIVHYDDDDVYLHTAPLCHIGGISSALAMLMAGGCHVIIPKFEANLASTTIREHHVTSLITVPTMMADLISFNRTRQLCENFESVKKVLNGGGGLSVELIRDAIKIFPNARLLTAYGMTEACSSITFMNLYDPTKGNHGQQPSNVKKSKSSIPEGICVGKPAPHVELRISAEESSSAGRILMRGPHAMLHYWGQRAEHLDPGTETWIDTGDIGRLDDDGNLWLMGRAKDKIKTGGENIYPEEVEAVLSQHPGISSIVVVGVPDPRLTEMVIACMQLKESWRWDDNYELNHLPGKEVQSLSSENLRQFCKEKNLTRYKIPKRYVVWRNSFPLTTTGKIRRDQVRAQVMSQSQILSSKL